MFDNIFGCDKESSDVKKFNKNDLLKKLINIDKDNFTEEELVNLLGLSKKEDKDEVKGSDFESKVNDGLAQPIKMMEIKSSSIFGDYDLAHDINTTYDSVPTWNENFEYNDSHTENRIAVLNKFREKPNLLQEKREIALIRAIIGYRDPFKPNDKHCKDVCLRRILQKGLTTEYENKALDVLKNFLNRTNSPIPQNVNDAKYFLLSAFELFSVYKIPTNIFLYALLRFERNTYNKLNSSVRSLLYPELESLMNEYAIYDDFIDLVNTINKNTDNKLEDLVFRDRDKCGLQEVISIQADLKILSCLRNILYSKKINPGMNPEIKKGFFNEMCYRFDLPYRLENLNDRQSASAAFDFVNKLMREMIGYPEEYGEPTKLDKAKFFIYTMFRETELDKVNRRLEKRLVEILNNVFYGN